MKIGRENNKKILGKIKNIIKFFFKLLRLYVLKTSLHYTPFLFMGGP